MTELYTAQDLTAQIAAINAIEPGSLNTSVVVPLARKGKAPKSAVRKAEVAAEGAVEAAGQVVVLPAKGKEPKKGKAAAEPKAPAEPKEPTGKKLDVNSKMRAFLKEWERTGHDDDTATYVLDGVTVVTRLNAVWSMTRGDETVAGKGAKELAEALK